MLNEYYKLANGVQIPKIALGTWQVADDTAAAIVRTAIGIGYRHIDTAANYENESGVAEGIRSSGADRGNLFITTKIPAEAKSYTEAAAMIERSLHNLNTDYIDLMLIHAPKPWDEYFRGSQKTYFEENIEVWKAMEEAGRAGKIRALGLSNFSQPDIENILQHSTIPPVVNQIQTYIGHTQEELRAYCKRQNILIMGFSPIATGELLQNTVLLKMAAKYEVSAAQLCIRYLLQRGILPIPKSTHESYIRQNAEVDFGISEEDMEVLNHFPDTVEPLAEKYERIVSQ